MALVGGLGWPGDILAEPDLTMPDGDLDEPLTIEHQLHYRLRLEDDPAVHGQEASLRLLHEHPDHAVTPFPAPCTSNYQT